MNKEEIDYWLRLFSDNNHAFMSKDGGKITLFKVFEELKKLQQENQKLKKQLESANEQISYLRRSIERKEERIIDLQDERIPYTNEYVDKLLNQQKEFISYLENEKDRLSRECSQIYEDSLGKTRLVNEDIFNEVNDILQKYKSIIGVLDEKSNNISS